MGGGRGTVEEGVGEEGVGLDVPRDHKWEPSCEIHKTMFSVVMSMMLAVETV